MCALSSLRGVDMLGAVDADVPDALLGDSTRLQQILINLLGNARCVSVLLSFVLFVLLILLKC